MADRTGIVSLTSLLKIKHFFQEQALKSQNEELSGLIVYVKPIRVSKTV